jgi:serine protease Do
MDDENEFNYSQENNFKKVSNRPKSPGFGRTVLIPLIFGMIGAAIIIGICFTVPSIKKRLIPEKIISSNENTNTNEEKNTNNSSYDAKLIDLAEYSETAVAVAEKVLPSVVGITVNYNVSTFAGQTTATATGSGVIISDKGYIITNNHVINSESSSFYYVVTEATSIKVHLYGDSEDKLYDAEVIGSDSSTDLAVLKIDAENITAIEVGDSDNLRVGEFVMAVGNPLGLDSSVTTGVISALDRKVDDDEGNTFITIQTDAAINAGNSGGALINSKGELIGINSLKLSGEGVEGIGFAMPINSSMGIIDQLIEFGAVKRPYIGIDGRNVTEELAERYNVPVGVYIDSVEENTPANKAGLQPEDIITEIDGEKISSIEELNEIKNSKYSVGDKIKLKVYRQDKYIDISLTLGELPEQEKSQGSLQDYYNGLDNYNGFYNDFYNYFGY